MLYLAKGHVIIQSYMNGRDHQDVIRIVEADSIERAEELFIKYWESKTSEYSVYYSVERVEVHEMITDTKT